MGNGDVDFEPVDIQGLLPLLSIGGAAWTVPEFFINKSILVGCGGWRAGGKTLMPVSLSKTSN